MADWEGATARFVKKQPPGTRTTLRATYARQLRLVKIFDEEGVPMLAGTDACGAARAVPGFSIHQEFAELAAAGLTPRRILRMATLDAAEFLGTTATAGTVQPGRRADRVLLDADPTADEANLRAIHAVVREGRLYDAPRLAAITESVAAARSVS